MLTGDIKWSFATQHRALKSGFVASGPVAAIAELKHVRDIVVPGGLLNGLHRTAAEIQKDMQTFAPWTDRSGDARKGLWAAVTQKGDLYFVAFGHDPSLDYPMWLEIRWNGRYAIVTPMQEIYSRRMPEIVAGDVRVSMSGRGSKFRHRKTGQFV